MITFRVDDTNLRRKANALLVDMKRETHPRHPLVRLDAWVKRELGRDWRAASVTRTLRVGTSSWAKFKPQYTRKDGTVVEAWGGIPRVDGKGTVKGRLRPSGRRVTVNSRQMIDTWALYRAVINSKPDIIRGVLYFGRKALHVETVKDYARKQLAMRKLSWPSGVQRQYELYGREWLNDFAAKWNRDRTTTRVFSGASRRSDVA